MKIQSYMTVIGSALLLCACSTVNPVNAFKKKPKPEPVTQADIEEAVAAALAAPAEPVVEAPIVYPDKFIDLNDSFQTSALPSSSFRDIISNGTCEIVANLTGLEPDVSHKYYEAISEKIKPDARVQAAYIKRWGSGGDASLCFDVPAATDHLAVTADINSSLEEVSSGFNASGRVVYGTAGPARLVETN